MQIFININVIHVPFNALDTFMVFKLLKKRISTTHLSCIFFFQYIFNTFPKYFHFPTFISKFHEVSAPNTH